MANSSARISQHQSAFGLTSNNSLASSGGQTRNGLDSSASSLVSSSESLSAKLSPLPSQSSSPSGSIASGSRTISTGRSSVSQLEDRQRIVWKEMHERMDRRRLEWNNQVDLMRKDFFRLSPRDDPQRSSAAAVPTGGADQRKVLSVVGDGGGGPGNGLGGSIIGGKPQLTKAVNVNQVVYVQPTRTSLTNARQQFQARIIFKHRKFIRLR